MNLISPAALHELRKGDPQALVIDVRTRAEHAAVGIEGTQVLPLSEIQPHAVTALTGAPGQPVYLLCTSSTRAKLAVERLETGGFHESIVVEGGLTAWQKAGLPVIKGIPRGIGVERKVRIAAGTAILLGSLLAFTTSPAFIGLSGVAGVALVLAGISGGAVQKTEAASSLGGGEWLET